MPNSVLIVDDDPGESQNLCAILAALGHDPVAVDSGGEALDLLDGRANFSAIILDLVMPDMDGMTVLQRLNRRTGHTPPAIVQVTQSGVCAANSALRAGAIDFLVKPATAERVRAALTNALRISRLERELVRVGRRRAGTTTLRELATGSPAMERAVVLAERASRSTIPILIEGEPGVGKEQIARAIHNAGPRRPRPFIIADAADQSASDRLNDILEEARGGTLYLENAGNLSESEQQTLLDHLREAAERMAAGGKAARTDIRVIAASDYRLIDLVSAGQFREDLFYRLNVLPIWLPPLRERRDDIPELANRCLTLFAAEQGKPHMREIALDAMQHLLNHGWPGNDQELENRLYRAVALASGPVLEREVLTQIGIVPLTPAQLSNGHLLSQPAEQTNATHLPQHIPQLDASSTPYSATQTINISEYGERRLSYGSRQLLNDNGEICKLESLEAEAIRFAIRHYQGRMSEVARRLGIGRSTLYRKLREYDLESERPSIA